MAFDFDRDVVMLTLTNGEKFYIHKDSLEKVTTAKEWIFVDGSFNVGALLLNWHRILLNPEHVVHASKIPKRWEAQKPE